MNKDYEKNSGPAGRRAFLKLATLGGVSSAAAAVMGQPAEAAAAAAAPDLQSSGYRETEHVMTYYKTARF